MLYNGEKVRGIALAIKLLRIRRSLYNVLLADDRRKFAYANLAFANNLDPVFANFNDARADLRRKFSAIEENSDLPGKVILCLADCRRRWPA